MTEGRRNVTETDRISRSYSEITSTLPCQSSVIALRQSTTLSGS